MQVDVDRHRPRSLETASAELELRVERTRAAVGAWYEFFPRSEGAVRRSDGTWRSGTFETAAERLPSVKAMGFDVLYLPPVHPIGDVYRKGRNNTLTPQPGDPGSPWAIGSKAGGHDTIHPDLGTIADYSVTYGSLAGVAITLLFFYLTGALFILGAEYNAVRLEDVGRRAAAPAAASP